MSISYTKDQEKVIQLRDRNILVSAAAGSGKTAVLVERIVQMVSDVNHPVDIDRLLIVTFTNAASAEMRERISLAIQKRIEREPDNEHLQRQAILIHNAQITTIDSFCLFVIRNNFNDINLDPGFRVADEGELKLLKKDILNGLLEEKFAEVDKEEFLHLVETFAANGKERGLEEVIFRLYDISMSYPWPEIWLEQRVKDYQPTTMEAMSDTSWGVFLCQYVMTLVSDMEATIQSALHYCSQEDGPYIYLDALSADEEQLQQLKKCKDLESLQLAFSSLAFVKLSSKKDEKILAEKRELVKNMRDEVKSMLQDLNKKFFQIPLELVCEQMKENSRTLRELLSLVLQFKRGMDIAKREKNLIDFSDMEHFALEILVRKTDSGYEATKTAKDYQAHFHEILIDEYQDSNLVQEYLLQSISGEANGHFNRFMVGDVKQSIYKFRLARPELFIEKFHTYKTEDGSRQRIDLHKNFRSRHQVVDSVNFLFTQIMGEALGKIEYDDEAALFPGANYPESTEDSSTELLLIKNDSDEFSDKEMEAMVIAEKIQSMVGSFPILDKETGMLRAAAYRDIVVLLRTNTGWDEEFKKVFNKAGIPAYVASKTGYFATTEIQAILNVLRVLDNPLQDIPLFGVMKSFFGGFHDEEIAQIKQSPQSLYKNLQQYGMSNTGSELQQKCVSFLKFLDEFREKVSYLPIHKLIRLLLQETAFLHYAASLPAGEQRKANVEMLLEKAEDFEKTSYFGLFHFLRYMEQMEKYDIDYGEANILDENADIVRIMSIHKSKGLEFPICFVAGMSKKFNRQDTSQLLICDTDLGIGMDVIDPEKRIKKTDLRKKVIARKMQSDNLGEELRILYVALTRAKEKLWITGIISDLEAIGKVLLPLMDRTDRKLPFKTLSQAGSYWDFILPAMARHSEVQSLLEQVGISTSASKVSGVEEPPINVQVVSRKDLEVSLLKKAINKENKRWKLEQLLNGQEDAEFHQKLSAKFEYRYQHENLRDLCTKTTVSELKKAGQQEEEDFSFHIIKEEEIQPYIPKFANKTESVSGSTRGSAYHKLLELLDFEAMEEEQLHCKIENLLEEGRMPREYQTLINPDKLLQFLNTELADRMKIAFSRQDLFREQPFVLGVPANLLNSDFPEKEVVLVQGIIDAYFMEDDELVLVDYKTDQIKEEAELIKRYHTQMDYYKEALIRLTGKKVKECWLYSFSLGRAVLL